MTDRACLRLLVRCGAATCNSACATRLRRAPPDTQRRLLRLYRAGLLERTTIADTPPGRCRARLPRQLSSVTSVSGPDEHQRPRRYVRHMLDTVDARLRPEPERRPRASARPALAARLDDRRRPRPVRPTRQHRRRDDRGRLGRPGARDRRRHRTQANDPRQARGLSTPARGPPELASDRRGPKRRSAPTGWSGRPRRWISARGHGSSPAPTLPETRWTPCSGRSTPGPLIRLDPVAAQAAAALLARAGRLARLARTPRGRRRRDRGRCPRALTCGREVNQLGRRLSGRSVSPGPTKLAPAHSPCLGERSHPVGQAEVIPTCDPRGHVALDFFAFWYTLPYAISLTRG